jgi:hypothetical protein
VHTWVRDGTREGTRLQFAIATSCEVQMKCFRVRSDWRIGNRRSERRIIEVALLKIKELMWLGVVCGGWLGGSGESFGVFLKGVGFVSAWRTAVCALKCRSDDVIVEM